MLTDISSELAKELKSAVEHYVGAKQHFVELQTASQEAFKLLVDAEARLQPILNKLSKELDQ